MSYTWPGWHNVFLITHLKQIVLQHFQRMLTAFIEYPVTDCEITFRLLLLGMNEFMGYLKSSLN